MPTGFGRPSTKPMRRLRTAVETAEKVVGKKDPRLRQQRDFMVEKGDKGLMDRQVGAAYEKNLEAPAIAAAAGDRTKYAK